MDIHVQELIINSASSNWWQVLLSGLFGGLLTAVAAWIGIYMTSEEDRKNRKYDSLYEIYHRRLLELNADIEELLVLVNKYNNHKTEYKRILLLTKEIVAKEINEIRKFKKGIKNLLIFNEIFKVSIDKLQKQLGIFEKYLSEVEGYIRLFVYFKEQNSIEFEERDSTDNAKMGSTDDKVISSYIKYPDKIFYSFDLYEFFEANKNDKFKEIQIIENQLFKPLKDSLEELNEKIKKEFQFDKK